VLRLPEGNQPTSTESDGGVEEGVHCRSTKLMVYILDIKDLDKVGREMVGEFSSEKLKKNVLERERVYVIRHHVFPYVYASLFQLS